MWGMFKKKCIHHWHSTKCYYAMHFDSLRCCHCGEYSCQEKTWAPQAGCGEYVADQEKVRKRSHFFEFYAAKTL